MELKHKMPGGVNFHRTNVSELKKKEKSSSSKYCKIYCQRNLQRKDWEKRYTKKILTKIKLIKY